MGTNADLSFELSGLQLAGPDMLVDDYEQYNNGQPDVVDISRDGASEEPAEVEPVADDCTCDEILPSALLLRCTDWLIMLFVLYICCIWFSCY